MKIIDAILNDIRKKQNLDIYITILISLVIAILGFAQVTNQDIISSAVLAVLALVSISLLVNRRENDMIQKSLLNIDTLQEKLDTTTSAFGIKVSFVSMEQGQEKYISEKIRRMVASATREVLILDYNPLKGDENKVRYRDEYIFNPERRKYYEALIERARNAKQGTFRYRRVLQVPQDRKLHEVVANDPVFHEHCEALIKLGERQPESANLKVCIPIHEGYFMIVDGRHLVLDISVVDPEDTFFIGGGSFVIDDPTGKIIEHFHRYFERADAYAVLAKLADLNAQ